MNEIDILSQMAASIYAALIQTARFGELESKDWQKAARAAAIRQACQLRLEMAEYSAPEAQPGAATLD